MSFLSFELLFVSLNFIAGVLATVVVFRLSRTTKIERDYQQALRDIQFLLVVEGVHCSLHKEREGESLRIKARQLAGASNVAWSGRNTLSQTARKIDVVEANKKNRGLLFRYIPLFK